MQTKRFTPVVSIAALAATLALGVPPCLASAEPAAPGTVSVELQQSAFRPHSIQTTTRFEIGRRAELSLQSLTVNARRISAGVKLRLVDESASRPSFSLGVTDVARYSAKMPSPNESFAIAEKHLGGIDIGAGAYNLNHAFVNGYPGAKAAGMLFHIGGNMTDRLSASLDAATNRTPIGMTTVALGYRVSRAVRISPAYVFFNDRRFGHNGLRLSAQFKGH